MTILEDFLFLVALALSISPVHRNQDTSNSGNKTKFSTPTQVAHTSCTSNTMHILFNITGQVKVDDVLYVGDVQTSSSHGGSHQHWGLATTECAQRLLALLLATVAMDTGHRVALGVEEVIQGIGTLLGLYEHQRQGVRAWATQEGMTWESGILYELEENLGIHRTRNNYTTVNSHLPVCEKLESTFIGLPATLRLPLVY